MSYRHALGVLLASGAIALTAAAPYSVSVDSGSAQLYQYASWTKSAVSGEATLDINDTLFLGGTSSATVAITAKTKLLLTDSAIVSLSGADSVIQVNLVKGQVFLSHTSGAGQPVISIAAKGCSFAPVGTAAAIRITKNENPSVAVLQGTMKASANGASPVEIAEGSFGTFDPATKVFKQGPLTAQAREKLQTLGQKVGTATTEVAQAAAPAGEPAPEAAVQPTTPPPAAQPTPVSTPVAQTTTKAAEPTASKPAEKAAPANEPKKEQAPSQTPPPAQPAAAANASPTEQKSQQAADEKGEAKSAASGVQDVLTKQFNAASVTVDGKQWVRLGFFFDIPIWRFGLGLDLELFLDENGNPSAKGWNFQDDPAEAILRKIRYIRFGHEQDKFFARFGGIENVTFGYGFVVDRFTNMLRYPDEKQLGLQVYLNDVSPIGISLQTMVADFKDFHDDGGILAARLGITPLKPTNIPLLNRMTIAGTYAADLNQYAPARRWDYPLNGPRYDRDNDEIIDSTYFYDNFHNDGYWSQMRDSVRNRGIADTSIENREQWASRASNGMSVIGGDIGIPIISSNLLNLTVYGQAGMSLDERPTSSDPAQNQAKGWGIGAPGVALNVGPLAARTEYRHTAGRFTPGYFSQYYQNERITRNPVLIKDQTLVNDTLDGVFGTASCNIVNIVTLGATYQRLQGNKDEKDLFGLQPVDQRFEAKLAFGDLLISKIPKVKRAEAFFYKTAMQRTLMNPTAYAQTGAAPDRDAFFEKTPNTYWGFRLGGEILPGALIVWETRYGWKFNESDKLVDDNQIIISAGLSF
jgi:outer membrane biosynthesis protein TonB